MRVVIVLALCSWSITAAAQAPVAVESAEQDPRTTCTAEGTLTAITIACHDAGVVPVRDRLACATLLTAELLPEAGLETLVECAHHPRKPAADSGDALRVT